MADFILPFSRPVSQIFGVATMNTQKSIELLNKAVADELQAVHQYMYWHFHLDDQGFGPLAAIFRRVAIVEMTHIELLSERILFLKGDVELVAAGGVKKIHEPEDILKGAAQMEREAVETYNQFALEAAQAADSATKQMFESLVNDEEGHFDEFDKQLDNIKRFGPSYLALQSFAPQTEPPAAGA
jgi:bacterioferritin